MVQEIMRFPLASRIETYFFVREMSFSVRSLNNVISFAKIEEKREAIVPN